MSEASFEYRYWALCLVAGAEESGLTPIANEPLHGLFFLSSALAPVYGEVSIVGLVMKYHRGPYYPALDWHLARLAVQGLLRVPDYQVKRDKKGNFTYARYAMTMAGAQFLSSLLDIEIWERRIRFFRDVCGGFARLAADRIDAAVEQDRTYAAPGKSAGDVSRFFEEETNPTIRSLESLRQALPKGISHSNQDLMRAYAALLNLRVA